MMEQSPGKPLQIRVRPANQHFGPPEAYKNISKPRGSVFIANFTHFENPKLEDRNESEVVDQLRQLFTQMNYEVDKGAQNETRENTLKSLERFRDLDIHESVDSTIVISMSYGTEEAFYAFDGKPITYKQVYGMFSNMNCPKLREKPKLFIFQSYITKDSDETWASEHLSRDKRKRARDVSNIYASISIGDVNVDRVFENGNPFFHHACKVFMDNAKDVNLDNLMKMVGRALDLSSPEEIPLVFKLGCKYDFHFNPPLAKKLKIIPTSAVVTEPTDIPLCLSEGAAQTCTSNSLSDSIYSMPSSPHGRVLIVNNLLGCKKDVEKLSDVFNTLDFDVLPPLSNLPHTELIQKLEEFKQECHTDSSVVIFYGHGFEDHLASSDNLAIRHRDITRMFNDSNCRNLAGKPKLFFFNSCVTEDCPYPVPGQTADHDFSNTQKNLTVHDRDVSSSCLAEVAKDKVADPITVDKDMVIFCAEVEGGDCEAGSLLTEALYQVLLDSRHSKKELSSLLRLVTERLDELSKGKKEGEEYFVVVSNIRFQKDFYFNLQEKQTTDSPDSGVGNKIYIPGNTKMVNGKAVIIGFTGYESGKFPKCDWQKNEIINLKDLTEKFGYSTEVHLNLALAQVQSVLQDVKDKEELDRADSLIFIVVGFAQDLHNFYDVKGKKLPVSNIFHSFTDKQCPKLKGKPKIFFFHMIESEEWQNTSKMPTADDDLQEAHLLYLLSSRHGNNELHLSEGLKVLCNSIESYSRALDIDGIIMEAEQELVCRQQAKFEQFIRKPIKVTKDFYFDSKVQQI